MKPIVWFSLFALFFLPQEASTSRDSGLSPTTELGTLSSSARAQRGHQAASVGSWAGLRLVVLADTSGTLASRVPLQHGVPDKGHRGSEVPSTGRRPPEVTEQPALTPPGGWTRSPPVQGEGHRLHLPRRSAQEFVVSHGLWWGRNI